MDDDQTRKHVVCLWCFRRRYGCHYYLHQLEPRPIEGNTRCTGGIRKCYRWIVPVKRHATNYSPHPYLSHQTTIERDSGESFSQQQGIKAYIPQVNHRSLSFPLIAADLSKFDGRHLGWEDPIVKYDYYNLYDDVVALDPEAAATKPILSRVQHYVSKGC